MSHPQVHRLVLLGLKCCPSQVLTCPETTGVTVLGMELNPSSLQPRAPPPPRPWLLPHAPLSSSSKFFQVTVFSGISERQCGKGSHGFGKPGHPREGPVIRTSFPSLKRRNGIFILPRKSPSTQGLAKRLMLMLLDLVDAFLNHANLELQSSPVCGNNARLPFW